MAEVPKYQEPYLVWIVKLVGWSKDNNITCKEKVNKTINELSVQLRDPADVPLAGTAAGARGAH